jgi:hypothetical protein
MPEIFSRPQLLWSHGSKSLPGGAVLRVREVEGFTGLGPMAMKKPPQTGGTQGNKRWDLPPLEVNSKSTSNLTERQLPV